VTEVSEASHDFEFFFCHGERVQERASSEGLSIDGARICDIRGQLAALSRYSLVLEVRFMYTKLGSRARRSVLVGATYIADTL
jgi:hypothetical protein